MSIPPPLQSVPPAGQGGAGAGRQEAAAGVLPHRVPQDARHEARDKDADRVPAGERLLRQHC